jgi:ABC-type branched-subunit amino acid transport system substrate-binding protein
MSRGAVLAGASVLIALVAAVALAYGPTSGEVVNPVAEEPKIRNVTIGVIPGTSSSLPTYTFLTRLAEEDINKYLVDEGLPYRFRFNITESVEQPEDALRYTKRFLSSGVKVVLGFAWSSHFCSWARVFGYNKTMVLMSPSAGYSGYALANDTLYRLCTTDFEPMNVTLRAMSDRGVKAVVAFSVYDNYEYNYHYLIERQLGPLGIEHYAAVASPSITQDFPVLDVEKLLDRADSAVAEAIQEYGANSTAVLFLPGGVDPIFHWPSEDPNLIGSSIREVVEAAANRSILSSVTWYGLEASANRSAYAEMPDGAAAKLKMISSVETFTPTPTFERVNALWLASEEVPPSLPSLHATTANIYDGLWVLSLSVVEANSTEPLPLMGVIPGVASGYVGATGRCTLDDAGDRLGADFDFYYYAEVDGVTKSVKLGSFGWEGDEFTWGDAK